MSTDKPLFKRDGKNIIQVNAMTMAKYDYSATQKNILYQILDQLQEYIVKDHIPHFTESKKLTINIGALIKNKNYDNVYDEAKKLLDKKVEYKWKDLDGSVIKTSSVLVSSVSHQEKSTLLDVDIPRTTLPVLCFLGNGFTKYQKTIAITLKSVYAKRMYEFCNQWKDRGGVSISIEDFREIMLIQDKLKRTNQLKTRFLDTARETLKTNADVWFEYTLRKQESRSYNYLDFTIHSNNPKDVNAAKGLYNKVYNALITVYPVMFNDRLLKIMEIFEKRNILNAVWNKVEPQHKKFISNEIVAKHYINTIKKILKDDFDITDASYPGEERKEQNSATHDIAQELANKFTSK